MKNFRSKKTDTLTVESVEIINAGKGGIHHPNCLINHTPYKGEITLKITPKASDQEVKDAASDIEEYCEGDIMSQDVIEKVKEVTGRDIK